MIHYSAQRSHEVQYKSYVLYLILEEKCHQAIHFDAIVPNKKILIAKYLENI